MFLQHLKTVLKTLTRITKEISFLIGDFIAKHRLWNNIQGNHPGKIMNEEMSLNFFGIFHPHIPNYYQKQAKRSNTSTIKIDHSPVELKLT